MYPSIAIKFSPNKFVKEGSSVLLDYKQVLYPKNCDGFIRQLQKKLVYQGADFTNIIDYLLIIKTLNIIKKLKYTPINNTNAIQVVKLNKHSFFIYS